MTITRLKHAPVGLFGRGHLPPSRTAEAYSGQWIQFGWRDVEKAPGHYDFTVLDSQREAMLRANPDWRARLRPFAGYRAPDYVKHVCGTYQATDSTVPGVWDVLVWWHPYAAERYRAFLAALAAHVEAAADVIEVSAALTTSVFAEPFIRQMADAATRYSMMTAGYTWAADQATMRAMLQAHHDLLPRTRTGIALNPAQNVETGHLDPGATIALATWGRDLMGRRLVLENNSLDADPGPLYLQMYDGMEALGRPIGFQTRAPVRLPDPMRAMELGITFGATALEPNNTDLTSLADAQAIAAKLKANAS